MKKQLIIALAFSIGAFSFAQKKELKSAERAITKSNFPEAKAALDQVKSLMSSIDEKSKAKYYYLLGQALYANGAGTNTDFDKAIESLDKVNGAYKKEITILKQTMTNAILSKGNKAYESEDYSSASKYFEHAYKASKSDTLFLYYAAATAVNVNEYDRALKLYEELKALGYTGIGKQYFATNKETGKEEIFDKTSRDLYVKSKTHINPGERYLDSKKSEIVKNIALIYVNKGDNEKAIAAMKAARSENPDDINLILSEANVHFKMGNNEAFKKLLEKATQIDPKNAELQYNLGVVSFESGDKEAAQKYYEKAIELDENRIDAYINLSALILNKEQVLIEEMNNLGTSKADNKRYDELTIERQNIYKDAVPYLDKALQIDPENINAAKTLMNIYSILGETEKYSELKSKIETLEGRE